MIARADDAQANLQAQIERFFRDEFTTDNPYITEAVRRMLAAGGKRLRPRVTLLAVSAAGGDATEQLHLAAYMELIHVATLIHDDVVDGAATRRGVNATAVDYGNRISVLAGDYLFAWIFKNVTALYAPPVPNVLSATLADICDGEVLQLRALADVNLTLDAYVEIVTKKTASLFAACAQCGALTAGAPAPVVEALREFGLRYGIAFQMRDDLLDLTADERRLGKPVGNDLRERKVTIPLILAMKNGDSTFRTMVERYFDGSSDGVAPVVAAIERNGGLQGTRKRIAAYAAQAKRALAPVGNTPAKAELATLADALALEQP